MSSLNKNSTDKFPNALSEVAISGDALSGGGADADLLSTAVGAIKGAEALLKAGGTICVPGEAILPGIVNKLAEGQHLKSTVCFSEDTSPHAGIYLPVPPSAPLQRK